MAKEYTDENIDAYLRGQLPAEQVRLFEQKLNEDAGFAETVKVRKAEKRIQDWLVREEVFKDKDKWLKMAQEAEDNPPEDRSPKRGNHNLLFWILGLTILVIVAFFLYQDNVFVEEKPSPTRPQAGWQEQLLERSREDRLAYVSPNLRTPPPLSVSTRSEDTRDLQDQANLGTAAYQEGRYAAAIRILSELEDEGTFPESAEEALAYSYFAQGSYTQAIPRFETLRRSESLEVRNRASWYLLLSFLAEYEQNQVPFQQLLDELSEEEDSPYRPAAERLRQQLTN